MCWWQWGQEEWKERRDLVLGLWLKKRVKDVVVSVECTHRKKQKKKQIKCVKERVLEDKAKGMWSKLWRTRDTPKCSYTLCRPAKIIKMQVEEFLKLQK